MRLITSITAAALSALTCIAEPARYDTLAPVQGEDQNTILSKILYGMANNNFGPGLRVYTIPIAFTASTNYTNGVCIGPLLCIPGWSESGRCTTVVASRLVNKDGLAVNATAHFFSRPPTNATFGDLVSFSAGVDITNRVTVIKTADITNYAKCSWTFTGGAAELNARRLDYDVPLVPGETNAYMVITADSTQAFTNGLFLEITGLR